MNKIKAVLLDFGNVISEQQDTTCFDRMASLTGLSRDVFVDGFRRYRSEFDRGTLPGLEMYRNILNDAGYRHETSARASEKGPSLDELTARLLDEDLTAWTRISGPVTEWALGLQKKGYKIGILSNMPFEFLERFESRVPLFLAADAAVFSCRVNLVKPEPEIYREAVKSLGVQAEEIVFFDDIQINIDAARAEKLNAFLWTSLAQAKKDLEPLLA